MSKTNKVELIEEKSSKIGFENTPKLFSKWSYDDVKVNLYLIIDRRSMLH